MRAILNVTNNTYHCKNKVEFDESEARKQLNKLLVHYLNESNYNEIETLEIKIHNKNENLDIEYNFKFVNFKEGGKNEKL